MTMSRPARSRRRPHGRCTHLPPEAIPGAVFWTAGRTAASDSCKQRRTCRHRQRSHHARMRSVPLMRQQAEVGDNEGCQVIQRQLDGELRAKCAAQQFVAVIEQVQPTADHERDQQRAFRCPGASTTPAKVFRVVIIARGQRRTKAPRSPSLTRSMLYDAESDPHLLLRATAPRERKKEKAPRSLAELCLSSSLQGEGFCCPGLRSKRREPRKVRATT